MITYTEHLADHEEEPETDQDTKLNVISIRSLHDLFAYVSPDMRLSILESGVHVL
jgi:hypothetical protein